MPSRSKEVVERIQHELARKGFDPGMIDGVWGRATEGAVRRFQAANGLLADGIVGPATSKVLFGEPLAEAPSGLVGSRSCSKVELMQCATNSPHQAMSSSR